MQKMEVWKMSAKMSTKKEKNPLPQSRGSYTFRKKSNTLVYFISSYGFYGLAEILSDFQCFLYFTF